MRGRPVAQMPVERGKVREYALATGSTRPEYLVDPRPVVPPTFLSTVVFWHPLDDVLQVPQAAAACAAIGVDADVTRLLSLEQEYLFPGPLPRAGDVLTTSTRVLGVEVVDGSRAQRVLVRFAVEFADPEGALRAECRYTSAFVGPERPGAARGPAPRPTLAAAGEQLPERRFGPVTMTDIVRYQGASGDLNPMHHDDDLARAAGYPAAFSVGMLGAGFLATYCTDQLGVATVRRFSTRFRSLVWRGDSLLASGRLVRVEVQGEQRARVQLRLVTGRGDVAVDGIAEFVTGGAGS